MDQSPRWLRLGHPDCGSRRRWGCQKEATSYWVLGVPPGHWMGGLWLRCVPRVHPAEGQVEAY